MNRIKIPIRYLFIFIFLFIVINIIFIPKPDAYFNSLGVVSPQLFNVYGYINHFNLNHYNFNYYNYNDFNFNYLTPLSPCWFPPLPSPLITQQTFYRHAAIKTTPGPPTLLPPLIAVPITITVTLPITAPTLLTLPVTAVAAALGVTTNLLLTFGGVSLTGLSLVGLTLPTTLTVPVTTTILIPALP